MDDELAPPELKIDSRNVVLAHTIHVQRDLVIGTVVSFAQCVKCKAAVDNTIAGRMAAPHCRSCGTALLLNCLYCGGADFIESTLCPRCRVSHEASLAQQRMNLEAWLKAWEPWLHEQKPGSSAKTQVIVDGLNKLLASMCNTDTHGERGLRFAPEITKVQALLTSAEHLRSRQQKSEDALRKAQNDLQKSQDDLRKAQEVRESRRLRHTRRRETIARLRGHDRLRAIRDICIRSILMTSLVGVAYALCTTIICRDRLSFEFAYRHWCLGMVIVFVVCASAFSLRLRYLLKKRLFAKVALKYTGAR